MTVRNERKLQTRMSIMDAALDLLEERRSFSSLSLREVAREAGLVPTAFYRHFGTMDELGLALVQSTSERLRELMRQARSSAMHREVLISTSVQVFQVFVQANRREFGFAIRERFGGSAVIRHAIHREIERFILDLSADLLKFPMFSKMSQADLKMICNLLVSAVANAAGEFLEVQPEDLVRSSAYRDMLVKQLRLIILGSLAWSPKSISG